jgi:Sulfotransferase family
MSETDRGRPVIVVSGLPRSGTSMAMQMLAAAHIPVVSDGVREPGEDNPRGYFEDERVKALYKDGEDRSWLLEARGKAIKIISFLLSYLPDSNRYKIIFMRRELSEVIASQRKMLERRDEPTQDDEERLFELWESHLTGVGELMSSAPNIEFIDVAYKDVVENAALQARRIRDFLEMELDVEKMAAAVDRKLYRNRV